MDCNLELKSPMLDRNIEIVKTKKFKQYVAALSVTLGTLCAGTVLGWSSPVLDQFSPEQNDSNSSNLTSSDNNFKLTDNEVAAVGGVVSLGALIFSIPAGYLADKFGRKKIILLTCSLFLLSYVIIILANNAMTLIIGRFIAGVAAGASCVLTPMYIGEIAETSIRGALASFTELSFALGILLSWIIGTFTNWVTFSMLLSFIPIAFGIIFLFMPESPVYLITVNQSDAAEGILRELRGTAYDVKGEIRAFQEEIDEANKKTVRIRDILQSKANRRALVSAVGVLIFQQLSGINAVVLYTAQVFKATGSTLSPNVVAIILGIVQVISSYSVIFVIEKAGRKFYLMISSLGMLIFLGTIGLYFHLMQLEISVTSIGFLPVGSAVLFLVFFCIGYGPIPWVLLSELFAPEIKGVANGFALLVSWLFSFFITFFFPIVNNSFGSHLTFYMFAGLMGLATVFVYYLVPETRGRSLPEIQVILNK